MGMELLPTWLPSSRYMGEHLAYIASVLCIFYDMGKSTCIFMSWSKPCWTWTKSCSELLLNAFNMNQDSSKGYKMMFDCVKKDICYLLHNLPVLSLLPDLLIDFRFLGSFFRFSGCCCFSLCSLGFSSQPVVHCRNKNTLAGRRTRLFPEEKYTAYVIHPIHLHSLKKKKKSILIFFFKADST